MKKLLLILFICCGMVLNTPQVRADFEIPELVLNILRQIEAGVQKVQTIAQTVQSEYQKLAQGPLGKIKDFAGKAKAKLEKAKELAAKAKTTYQDAQSFINDAKAGIDQAKAMSDEIKSKAEGYGLNLSGGAKNQGTKNSAAVDYEDAELPAASGNIGVITELPKYTDETIKQLPEEEVELPKPSTPATDKLLANKPALKFEKVLDKGIGDKLEIEETPEDIGRKKFVAAPIEKTLTVAKDEIKDVAAEPELEAKAKDLKSLKANKDKILLKKIDEKPIKELPQLKAVKADGSDLPASKEIDEAVEKAPSKISEKPELKSLKKIDTLQDDIKEIPAADRKFRVSPATKLDKLSSSTISHHETMMFAKLDLLGVMSNLGIDLDSFSSIMERDFSEKTKAANMEPEETSKALEGGDSKELENSVEDTTPQYSNENQTETAQEAEEMNNEILRQYLSQMYAYAFVIRNNLVEIRENEDKDPEDAEDMRTAATLLKNETGVTVAILNHIFTMEASLVEFKTRIGLRGLVVGSKDKSE